MEDIMQNIPEDKKFIMDDLIHSMKDILSGGFDFKNAVLSEWKGYKFPPSFEGPTAKRAYEDMKVEENSVFIVSFPKTGTNWAVEILQQIMYGDDEKRRLLLKKLPPPFFFLEVWKENKFDLLEYLPIPRKIFYTHLPEELLNFEKIKKSKSKVIIMVRNPKDQAVSWFHFSRQKHFEAIREELSDDWNQFFDDYVQGKHRLLTKPGEWYPEFLLGWYKHRNEENVLFVHFEDMKKDPQSEISRIAKFLDVKITDERINAVARDTSIDAMKKATSDGGNIQKSFNIIRKGQVGSWKDTFTVAQSESMDKLIEEKLGHTDFEFTYVL